MAPIELEIGMIFIPRGKYKKDALFVFCFKLALLDESNELKNKVRLLLKLSQSLWMESRKGGGKMNNGNNF